MADATNRPQGSGVPADALAATEASGRSGSVAFAFPEGAVIAGRYRVLRFVARGGMGEVYEVLDTTLNERMALKTLRGGSGDPEALERFKRELSLARRVTHRNVCRVFDLGTHRAAEGGGEVLFLTMELLAGESLSDHLARVGRMTVEQARPIVRQLVEALAAAHSAGVVHRDFKSPNVMLVPTPGGPPRAVVTDFGLARAPEAASATATAAGALLGTPAYMAPEQASGQVAGPAADVYALGVVLFEMVTGRLPFEGGSALEVATRRLYQPAPSPRMHQPGLDAVWDKAILRCLERDPRARFADVRGVGAALEPAPELEEKTAAGAGTARRRRRSLPKSVALSAALLLLFALLAVVLGRSLLSGAGRLPEKPFRLVDLGIRSRLLGEQANMGRAVNVAMHAALDDCDDLTVYDRESTVQMGADLALPESDRHSAETAQRVARYSGADHLIVGTLSADGDKLALEVALQDAATGALQTRRLGGSRQELGALGAGAAAAVRELLDLPARPEAKLAASARGALPQRPAALAPFLDGLDRLWRKDFAAAREKLQQAAAEDPDHGPTWAALAMVAQNAWDPTLGEQATGRALQRGGFAARTRRWLEAQEPAFRGDWERSVALHRKAFDALPGLDTGSDLAAALVEAGHAGEVYAVLERLRALGPPDGEAPLVYEVEVSAAVTMHDPERALAAARRGQQSAQERGARRSLAQLQRREGLILTGRGEYAKAWELAEQSRQTCLALGDNACAARALWILAGCAWALGEGARCQAYWEEAAELESGSPAARARSLLDGAYTALERGSLEAGERLVAAARDRLDLRLQRHRGVLGFLDALLKEGRGELAASRDAFAELATRDGTTGPLAAGNRAVNQGKVLLASGDLKTARESLERARDIFMGGGYLPEVARTRVWLAWQLLAEGRALEAANEARGAASDLERFGMPGYLAQARAAESSALLARGDAPGALAAAKAAQALSARHDYLLAKVQVEAALARALAKSGDAAGARQAAQRLAEVATSSGMAQPRLQARLVAAEVESAFGKVAEGRKRLEVVAADAERSGYRALAEQARRSAEALGR